MKLTNRANLPDAIVRAVQNDPYGKGDADFSVTGLLKPPRATILARRHADEITEDVADRVWSLLGQSVHVILERANVTGIAERRLYIDLDGVRISGGMDLYEAGVLSDYKLTSVWKLVKGDMDEWVRQLSMYSAILRHNGHPVEKVQVIALLRDWSKREAERDPFYPQAQVVNVPLPLWEPDRAVAFMRMRIAAHEAAKKTLPECTPEERWAKPPVWAVMKKGAKRAVKLFASEDEARTFMGLDNALSVEYRPGESVRCQNYCSAVRFCSQAQALGINKATSDRPAEAVSNTA